MKMTRTLKVASGNAVTYTIDNPNCVLIHVCNDRKVMGAGIAKEIREKLPKAFEVYVDASSELGTISISDKVVNMVAQSGFRLGRRDDTCYLNYGALAKCLQQISHIIPTNMEIVLPYNMGACRAGGDFEIVMQLVTFLLPKHNITMIRLSE